jgi:hypothetical protein
MRQPLEPVVPATVRRELPLVMDGAGYILLAGDSHITKSSRFWCLCPAAGAEYCKTWGSSKLLLSCICPLSLLKKHLG